MEPKFKIFHNDETLSETIDKLRNDGIRDEDMYILAYDNDHDRRARKDTDAKKVGMKVVGFGTSLKNVFRGKTKTILTKLQKLGFDSEKSERLEEELQKGKTLLVVTNQDQVEF
ncbi:general stress protein [Marinococcus halotolerans]|jgi:hypothetical protein|uniref:general stress protein n=1 Tax=Marinococcus halotolerans TaxID=301092 RepID=UPI0003B3E238|nr:general stress protein [Marinococcus halotolerans]